MDPNKEIRALIEAHNSGKKIPAPKIIEDAPLTAAILSKLHGKEITSKFDNDGNKTINAPNQSGMSDISSDVAQKATDNENILQIHPELKEGLRILVNGTMAPKDLNSTEINFSLPTNLKVSPLSAKLMPIIEETLSKDFKLKATLPELLYQTLGIDGSYPMLIIPESSVDDMINDRKSISTESMIEHFGNGTSVIKSMGFIGNSDLAPVDASSIKNTNVSFESFVENTSISYGQITDSKVYFKKKDDTLVDTLVRVTDNVDLIKFPTILANKRNEQINRKLGTQFRGSSYAGLESFNISGTGSQYGSKELNDIQLQQLLYKNSPNIRNVTRKVKTANETTRYNIGAPLVKHLPAECVIPVCLSGDKKKHIAYFVLLDGMGNALSKESAGSVYDDFRRNQSKFKGGSNLSSYLVQRTADSLGTSCDVVTYQQMQRICTDIIETDFLSRLRNGLYGNDVALVENSDFYEILLSRIYREQQTQVLFVPAELLTYFHFELRKNGTGKTLLEDSLTINALRSVLLFANVNRAVINSLGRTEIELTVDENDPNKQKTLEIAKHEALKTRQSQALPATISPTDIQRYLQSSQMYFNITAVPGLPATSIKFNETQTNYAKPEIELMTELDKKAIIALGVPPELVANSRDVEFATNIVANNLRLSKQILTIQEAFQPHVCKFARTFCMNHGTVVERIEETIRDNLSTLTDIKDSDELIDELKGNEELLVKLLAKEFLSNFEVSFSKPDTVTLKNQMEAFNEFEMAVDKAISYYLSTDILSEATSGEITAEQVDLIRNSLKAHLIRDFLKKNAILPEIFNVVKTDSNGKQDVSAFRSASSHAQSMTVAIKDFLTKVLPVAEATERDMETATGGKDLQAGPSASGTSGSSTGSDTSSGDTDTDTENEDDTGVEGLPAMPDFSNF